MFGLYRFWGFSGCFIAGGSCLREAGLVPNPIWVAPTWLNVILAVAFILSGLRILGGGTER